MKLSAIREAESALEAYQYEQHSLNLVEEVLANANAKWIEVLIDGHKTLEGAFEEPRDLDAFRELQTKILLLLKQYLERTTAEIRSDLASLGVEVDC
jgi:hypothetical protein